MMARTQIEEPFSRLIALWIALCAVLAGSALVLSSWSGAFARTIEVAGRPSLQLAVALTIAGFLYLLTVPLILRSARLERARQKAILWIILAAGLAMRLALFGSTPVLEDDWYRYLWDGGVVANGYNPYAASPDDAQAERYHYTLLPLAQQSGVVIERINHSELTTVYPPVAQAAFALAHSIAPWSLEAWRGVCLAAELATLALLLALLDQVGRSRLWVALYWLSPLAAKELINSAHMDGIVTPFVMAAALLALRQRHVLAIAALGLAIGAKFWPLLLAPLLLRPLLAQPWRLGIAVLVLAVLCAAALLPMIWGAANDPSGLTAYASYWRNNSAHYGLLEKAFAFILKPFALDPRTSGVAARAMLAGLAGLFALWIAVKTVENGTDLMTRMGLVIAAVVLLSPSQFPWYAVWVLPFLVFAPWVGLLVMTALISIYYAGFYYSAREIYSVYREGIVFAIWLPVWALLAYEAWRVLIARQSPLIETEEPSAHA